MGMMNSNAEKPHAAGKLYHERQVKALCALHALNNLFQKKQTFTKKDLDQICERLSPGTLINPHRSMLGLGNYDVNVLMAALQEKGYETIWFDKRKNVDVLVPENIMGFILNTPSDYRFGPLKLALHCKHWIALRRLNGQYINLDSKLSTPVTIGDCDKLVEFLQGELEDGKKELLLVVEKEVYEASLWRRESLEEEEVTEKVGVDNEADGERLQEDQVPHAGGGKSDGGTHGQENRCHSNSGGRRGDLDEETERLSGSVAEEKFEEERKIGASELSGPVENEASQNICIDSKDPSHPILSESCDKRKDDSNAQTGILNCPKTRGMF